MALTYASCQASTGRSRQATPTSLARGRMCRPASLQKLTLLLSQHRLCWQLIPLSASRQAHTLSRPCQSVRQFSIQSRLPRNSNKLFSRPGQPGPCRLSQTVTTRLDLLQSTTVTYCDTTSLKCISITMSSFCAKARRLATSHP